MTTKVIMPQMGESVFECTLTKWLKKVGDTVARDEPLFEISTDKVDSEIPSPASGILGAILVPEGKIVQINTVVAIINGNETVEQKTADLPTESVPEEEIPKEPQKPEPAPAAVPRETGRPAAVRVPAAEKIAPSPEISSSIQLQDIRTSPLVRRLARENNVDLAKIKGTGLGGRITKDDLFSFLDQRSAPEVPSSRPEFLRAAEPELMETPAPAHEVSAPPASEIAAPAPSLPEMPRFLGESETVPMTPMRKAIAEHMVLSKRISAHVNTVFEVDVSSIVQLRQTHKEEFEKREGVPLLMDVPVLGYFFSRKDITETKTTVLIFITPKIID